MKTSAKVNKKKKAGNFYFTVPYQDKIDNQILTIIASGL